MGSGSPPYRRLVLSCAVASSVLAGALLVGDSVRGSLEDLTLERLGAIDFALVGSSYFRQELHDMSDDMPDDDEPRSIYQLGFSVVPVTKDISE